MPLLDMEREKEQQREDAEADDADDGEEESGSRAALPIAVCLEEYDNEFGLIEKLATDPELGLSRSFKWTQTSKTSGTVMLLNEGWGEATEDSSAMHSKMVELSAGRFERWRKEKEADGNQKIVAVRTSVVSGRGKASVSVPLTLVAAHAESTFEDTEVIQQACDELYGHGKDEGDAYLLSMDGNCQYDYGTVMTKGVGGGATILPQQRSTAAGLFGGGDYQKVMERMQGYSARSCLEHPAFDGPFYTVNKMRTPIQPQQVKANDWDVSSKDFICFKPGNSLEIRESEVEAGAVTATATEKEQSPSKLAQKQLLVHPMIAKVAAHPTFADKCFQFRHALVGPLGAQNYQHSSALMPNAANPSDHALVLGIVPLKIKPPSPRRSD